MHFQDNIINSYVFFWCKFVFFLHSAGMGSRGTLFGPAASQMIQEVCDNIGDACQSISESGGAPASLFLV